MIMEKVRCMLSNANLPRSFWAEADSTVCLLINRSPFIAIKKKTSQELKSKGELNPIKGRKKWSNSHRNRSTTSEILFVSYRIRDHRSRSHPHYQSPFGTLLVEFWIWHV
ncbi:hypothetical protein V6Z12_A09G047500 [Gossypium hirsutum]